MVADVPGLLRDGRRSAGDPDGLTTGGPDEDISPNDAYRILRDRRRRLVPQYFSELLGVDSDLGRIADYVHQRGTGNDQDRRGIETQLHHAHLPILDSRGVIEYDHRTGNVRYVGSYTLERFVRVATEVGSFP